MSAHRKFKISFNSPVILGFVIICFAVLAVSTLTGGYTDELLFSVYRSSWTDPLTYVRLVGHVFGHAGIEHLIGNMMLILVVGPLLEEKYGSWNMVFVILSTAVITGLVNVLLFPDVALMGASGIVFALILLSSFTSLKEGQGLPLTFILVAVLYIGQQIYMGISADDNVSQLTHLVGGAVGAGIGYLLNRNKL